MADADLPQVSTKRFGLGKTHLPKATLRHNSFPHCRSTVTTLGLRGMEMVAAMCTTTISTLTLTGLLQDPLIKMVMRSDNVSEQDHSELLYRVKDTLMSRDASPEPVMQVSL